MRHAVRALFAFLTLSTSFAVAASAQTGLLVVAHGADSVWNAKVRETVAQVQWKDGPVAVAFLMGPEATSGGWETGVNSLVKRGAKEIVAVPLMVSSHGGHFRQIEYYAGLRASLPEGLMNHGDHPMPHSAPPVPVRVTSALDAAPELGVALAERWQALSDRDHHRPVMLVAHGPSDEEEARAWVRNIASAARVLPLAGLQQPVEVALLKDDAAPAVRAAAVNDMRQRILALSSAANDSVVVLPVLISTGPILDTKIPADLKDLPVSYSRTALTPLPALARWIERIAESTPGRLSLAP
jgi:sirohydrochlorin ferrochelatase